MKLFREAAVSYIFVLVTAAAGCYIVAATVRQLAPAANASAAVFSLWRLILLSLGGGTIAFTIVEFVKRISPLRSWFNKRAVLKWFGPIDDSSRFRIGGSASVYYSGNVQQVTAQISQSLRHRRGRLVSDPNISPAESAERREFDEELERELDGFQIKTTAQWHYLLRAIASAVSGVLSLISALAAHARLSVAIGALLFGAIVGGPFSWVIRDLTRAIERRANF